MVYLGGTHDNLGCKIDIATVEVTQSARKKYFPLYL